MNKCCLTIGILALLVSLTGCISTKNEDEVVMVGHAAILDSKQIRKSKKAALQGDVSAAWALATHYEQLRAESKAKAGRWLVHLARLKDAKAISVCKELGIKIYDEEDLDKGEPDPFAPPKNK